MSLCPCAEPIITGLEWDEDTSILKCSVVSIEGHENLTITWTENGTLVQDKNTTTSSTGDLMMTSYLSDVTSTEESRNYTCTASLKSKSEINVTRSKRIPALAEEEESIDGEENEVKDKDDSSGALLTIIISAVLGCLVVMVLICVGIVYLVRRFNAEKIPEPSEVDAVEPTAGNSSDEQQIITSQQDRESGTKIESTYHQLEELLDAVETRE